MTNPWVSLISFFVWIGGSFCWAHALLLQSIPQDHAQLKTSPEKIVLRFNGQIEKKVSQITLLDKQGKRINLPQSATRFSAGKADSLEILIPKLDPGTYQLRYRILAMDGHTTPGLIHFSISDKVSQ